MPAPVQLATREFQYPSPMSLLGNGDRVDGYYNHSATPHQSEHQDVHHSYIQSKAPPALYSPVSSSGYHNGTGMLPPAGALMSMPTNGYSSQAQPGPPVSYSRRQYAPINTLPITQPPPSMVYMDSQPSTYGQAQHPGVAFSPAGSSELAGSGQVMRAPVYPQPSPVSSLPSPQHGAYPRPYYGYSGNTYGYGTTQNPHYVHQAGSTPQASTRGSFSTPNTATSPNWPHYSQPTTPQLPRDSSSMYSQPTTVASQINATPRQAPTPTYQEPPPEHPPKKSSGRVQTSAAPGPIPAEPPWIETKADGTNWLHFWYTQDKQKREWCIRADIETVDLDALDDSFKTINCVYTKTLKNEDPQRPRRAYETAVNEIAWALSSLNADLRGKRGLTQRAVDYWRNTNSDIKMRSRRIKRQGKNKKKELMSRQMQASSQNVIAGAGLYGLQGQRLLPEINSPSHKHSMPKGTTVPHPKEEPKASTTPSQSPENRRYLQGYQHDSYAGQHQTGLTSQPTYQTTNTYNQHNHTTYNMIAPQDGASQYDNRPPTLDHSMNNYSV